MNESILLILLGCLLLCVRRLLRSKAEPTNWITPLQRSKSCATGCGNEPTTLKGYFMGKNELQQLRQRWINEHRAKLKAEREEAFRRVFQANQRIRETERKEYERQTFRRNEQGQDIIEYSLVLVLIAIVALVVLTDLGVTITSVLTRLTETLNALAQ